MSSYTVVLVILLSLGSLGVVISCLGILIMPGAYSRLHYLSPAATLGTIAFAAAILWTEGFSASGIKALLIAAILVSTSPVLTHAIARAVRIREFGQWKVLPSEKEE